MSPGATMERVYRDLKTRIMRGDFAPGTRLDPARLAEDLGASTTPVRDALHRLSGERMIDAWEQEGFRLPISTEAELHDLYDWAQMLLELALRRGGSGALEAHMLPLSQGSEEPAERIAGLFRAIAMRAPNHELRQAIAAATERSHVLRRFEAEVDPRWEAAMTTMEALFRGEQSELLRREIVRFHRVRIRQLGALVLHMRPRSAVRF